ncbi:MAG: hypothetical protein KAH32_04340 [Chlamydiia bacterium]|nr:hypothetical protein [Chlamydiia bacterium]
MTAAISKGQLIAPLTSPFVGIKIEGYKTLAQQEMDGITVDMVKTAIIQQIGAPTGQDTPFMPSN